MGFSNHLDLGDILLNINSDVKKQESKMSDVKECQNTYQLMCATPELAKDYRVRTRQDLNGIINSIRNFSDESPCCEDKRAASLAVTKLQEAGMWFTSSFFSEKDRVEFSENS